MLCHVILCQADLPPFLSTLHGADFTHILAILERTSLNLVPSSHMLGGLCLNLCHLLGRTCLELKPWQGGLALKSCHFLLLCWADFALIHAISLGGLCLMSCHPHFLSRADFPHCHAIAGRTSSPLVPSFHELGGLVQKSSHGKVDLPQCYAIASSPWRTWQELMPFLFFQRRIIYLPLILLSILPAGQTFSLPSMPS